jgi:hypothetical protein
MSSLMAEVPADAHATRRFLRVVSLPGAVPSPAVTPFVVIAAGVVAIAVGTLLLRTYGPRIRVARLLAVTPTVGIAEARTLAQGGVRRYVRIDGRLDADEELLDENGRPLVLRRRRVETPHGRDWRLLEERLDMVPFRVREGLDEIDVDAGALDVGLVTLLRESVGTAAEAAGALPPAVLGGLAPHDTVRLRVEQLSSVEHATVLGMPQTTADGRVTMTSGTGRPLVVSTLERDEAMRVLAEGRRARPMAAAGALGGGLVALAIGLLWALLAGGTG